MREPIRCRERSPELPHEPPRESRGAFYADLLADDGSRGQFESIPTTWYAQPGSSINAARQQRISAQNRIDRQPVGIQIEHGADALDDKKQATRIGELQPDEE